MSTTLLSLLFFVFFGPADDAVAVTAAPLPPSAIIAEPAGGRAAFPQRDVRRIGVTTRRVDDALAYHLDVDPSAALLVASTVEGMPAREAGVQRYDVIVSVDGAPPHSSDVLREAVQTRDEVVLVVRRGAESTKIVVPVREVSVAKVEARGLFGTLSDVEQILEIDEVEPTEGEALRLLVERLRSDEARTEAGARLAENEALQRSVELAEIKRLGTHEKLRAIERELAAQEQSGGSDAIGLVVERVRSAAAASERAALEEARAGLARERAEVEARRAEVEALRGALATWGEEEDRVKLDVARNDLEVELAKLRSAAEVLHEKQELLELKAGEALIRRKGKGTSLVLPSDRAIIELKQFAGGRRDDHGLDGVRAQLDELHEMTREILEILKSRSAR